MKGRADDAGPDAPVYGPSKLVESIIVPLEEAGAPESLTDAVVKLIEEWEWSQNHPHAEEFSLHPDDY